MRQGQHGSQEQETPAGRERLEPPEPLSAVRLEIDALWAMLGLAPEPARRRPGPDEPEAPHDEREPP